MRHYYRLPTVILLAMALITGQLQTSFAAFPPPSEQETTEKTRYPLKISATNEDAAPKTKTDSPGFTWLSSPLIWGAAGVAALTSIFGALKIALNLGRAALSASTHPSSNAQTFSRLHTARTVSSLVRDNPRGPYSARIMPMDGGGSGVMGIPLFRGMSTLAPLEGAEVLPIPSISGQKLGILPLVMLGVGEVEALADTGATTTSLAAGPATKKRSIVYRMETLEAALQFNSTPFLVPPPLPTYIAACRQILELNMEIRRDELDPEDYEGRAALDQEAADLEGYLSDLESRGLEEIVAAYTLNYGDLKKRLKQLADNLS